MINYQKDSSEKDCIFKELVKNSRIIIKNVFKFNFQENSKRYFFYLS